MSAPRERPIVIASRIYAPEGGAAAFRLAAVGRAVKRAGLRLRVLTTRVPGADAPSTPEIRRWPVLRDASGAVRGYLSYASFDLPLVFRILFGPRPRIVLSETPPTTGLAVYAATRLRRCRYVYFAADVLSTAAAGIGVNRWAVGLLRRMEGFVLRHAETVLAISARVAEEVEGFGVPRDRIVDVGTGIDTELFSPEGERLELGGPAFVYAGTMSEIQGAGVFVDAFARIAEEFPTARLVFFGRGTEEHELRERAARISDRIEFRGQVDGATVAAAFRGALAGLASVRPNSGYDFAYATKAFASVGCAAPVLYAGVGAAREPIAANGLGVVADWDPEAVAGAMRRLLAEPVDATRRAGLAAWVEDNASLNAVAERSLAALLAASPQPGSR